MSDNKTKGMTVSRRQFLLGSAALGGSLLLPSVVNRAWAAGSDAPELKEIRVGFIPLTDCASVVMASVKGFDKNTVLPCSPAKRPTGPPCVTRWCRVS